MDTVGLTVIGPENDLVKDLESRLEFENFIVEKCNPSISDACTSCQNLNGGHAIFLFTMDPSKAQLNKLYSQLMGQRKRCGVHIVKAFGSAEPVNLLQCGKRAFLDISAEPSNFDELVKSLQDSSDTARFTSPGESFAWQLVTGFLSYILPTFSQCIASTLLDQRGCIRADILHQFGIGHLNPKQVLVLPKYFLLIDERIVTGELSIAMNPCELFPGCKKISLSSSELSLEFDSPGYKKRIASYLIKLEQPLTRHESTVSHVIMFAGYAAPMFVMQKLDMSNDDKKIMVEHFTDELQFIVHHPKSSKLFREFSDCNSSCPDNEEAVIKIVDVLGSSLKPLVLQEAENFALDWTITPKNEDRLLESETDDWVLITEDSAEPPERRSGFDELLSLMSMGYALAANTWFGFAQHLQNYLRLRSAKGAGERLPFDLPYYFVIPKSGRYPNPAQLLAGFKQVGVTSEEIEFSVTNGRTYTFQVHCWRGRRFAFEIPVSVLGIRKQVECKMGGASARDLSEHLGDFREELSLLTSGSEADFSVIDWDDAAGFPGDACMESSREYALSLLKCLYDR